MPMTPEQQEAVIIGLVQKVNQIEHQVSDENLIKVVEPVVYAAMKVHAAEVVRQGTGEILDEFGKGIIMIPVNIGYAFHDFLFGKPQPPPPPQPAAAPTQAEAQAKA